MGVWCPCSCSFCSGNWESRDDSSRRILSEPRSHGTSCARQQRPYSNAALPSMGIPATPSKPLGFLSVRYGVFYLYYRAKEPSFVKQLEHSSQVFRTKRWGFWEFQSLVNFCSMCLAFFSVFFHSSWVIYFIFLLDGVYLILA